MSKRNLAARTAPRKRGRPPTEHTAPEVAEQIRLRLKQGDTLAHIRRDLGVGSTAVTRIKQTIDGEQEAERRALLVRIAGYVVKGSNLSKREISDLIYKATGVRLNPGSDA
jgi:hypothetical protein